MNEQVVILDFGSQYTQVIARRIRECKVYSTILHYNTPASEISKLNPKGIILSGGPSSVYSRRAPLPDKEIFNLGVPILGICFGLQLMAKYLDGKVEKGQKREYGKGILKIKNKQCLLFSGLPNNLQVWNSHGDKLTNFRMALKLSQLLKILNSQQLRIKNLSGMDYNFTRKLSTLQKVKKLFQISSIKFANADANGQCVIM